MFRGIRLVNWKIIYTKQAQKDAKKISNSGLKNKVEKLLEILREDPYTNNPPYKKLVGDLKGTYSRRINIKHRLIYQVYEDERTIKVISMWTHYE